MDISVPDLGSGVSLPTVYHHHGSVTQWLLPTWFNLKQGHSNSKLPHPHRDILIIHNLPNWVEGKGKKKSIHKITEVERTLHIKYFLGQNS